MRGKMHTSAKLSAGAKQLMSGKSKSAI